MSRGKRGQNKQRHKPKPPLNAAVPLALARAIAEDPGHRLAPRIGRSLLKASTRRV